MKYFKFALYLAVLAGFVSAHAGSYTAFFRAVNLDNPALVRELLEQGFDPNAPNDDGQVGLFLALRDGDFKAAEVLLGHPGLKVDQPNASDETPLMMAALRGQVEWVRRLLARGAKVNRPGWTPLHYAATSGGAEVVTLLLDQGAAIDSPSPNGSTPLMMAARYGTEASAALLLQKGADTAVRNAKGMTAADFARSAGRSELARRLEAPAR